MPSSALFQTPHSEANFPGIQWKGRGGTFLNPIDSRSFPALPPTSPPWDPYDFPEVHPYWWDAQGRVPCQIKREPWPSMHPCIVLLKGHSFTESLSHCHRPLPSEQCHEPTLGYRKRPDRETMLFESTRRQAHKKNIPGISSEWAH